jgi:hypothetical protein
MQDPTEILCLCHVIYMAYLIMLHCIICLPKGAQYSEGRMQGPIVIYMCMDGTTCFHVRTYVFFLKQLQQLSQRI